jgi:hypothetical protein
VVTANSVRAVEQHVDVAGLGKFAFHVVTQTLVELLEIDVRFARHLEHEGGMRLEISFRVEGVSDIEIQDGGEVGHALFDGCQQLGARWLGRFHDEGCLEFVEGDLLNVPNEGNRFAGSQGTQLVAIEQQLVIVGRIDDGAEHAFAVDQLQSQIQRNQRRKRTVLELAVTFGGPLQVLPHRLQDVGISEQRYE